MVSLSEMTSGPNSKFFIGGGIIAAGLIVYEYRKSKTAALATAGPVDSSTDAGYTDSSYSGDYSGDTSGLFGYTQNAPTGSVPYQNTTTIVTNQQWEQAVTQLLVNEGFDAITVNIALGHFLAGTANTPAQDDIVQAAIALEGQPPQGAPPRHITPDTPTGTTNAGTPKDGFYILFPQRFQYQVQGGKLYQLSIKTAADMKKQGVHPTTILINNSVMRLPHGSPFVI